MFETRLRWFVALIALTTLPLLARLVEIQLVRADQYSQYAERAPVRVRKSLRAPRGAILDRAGRQLVHDVPAADIAAHYAVLAGGPELRSNYLRAQARRLRDAGALDVDTTLTEAAQQLEEQIDPSWKQLADLTGRTTAEFAEVADQVRRRIARMRSAVERRTGVTQPIREEQEFHPVLEGLSDAQVFEVRRALEGRCPWISVVPGSRRVTENADTLLHLLGREATASEERIESDPLAEDELRRLRPGDTCGVSGVERACDVLLRGRRGVLTLDANGTTLERIDATSGQDVTLTVDTEFQDQVAEILQKAVDASENPAGGSAVVIDVETREVLALVSYPSYTLDAYAQNYSTLAGDTHWTPLRFRAVANEYAPGSVCKVVTLTGALTDGAITPATRFECTGVFQADQAEHFRCWIYNQFGLTHGPQTAEDAIRNSCNIFCFHTGERLGAQRLCDWYRFMGLGELQGTGLIEEADGIVPTAEWLQANQRRDYQPADAWNYAIGQGEIAVTPLQMANLAATVAAGYWAPVVLMKDEFDNVLRFSDAEPRALDENALRVVRTGMWRVVNENGGTAYHARLERSDYQLCGKTGSAQTVPRVIDSDFTFEWPDGRREVVTARTAEEAATHFSDPRPALVGRKARERFPVWHVGDKMPSHAWFIGYVQPSSTARGNAPRGKSYAISVLIEFGGGGGKVAGPVARDIAAALLARQTP